MNSVLVLGTLGCNVAILLALKALEDSVVALVDFSFHLLIALEQTLF